jgi:anionic cell wall polymer biosynthesis LytR-Cps2A-Psr (LCP) family protein
MLVGRTGKDGGKPSRWSTVPRWARLCTIFGTVLVVLSGAVVVGYQALLSRYEGSVGKGDLFGDQAAGAQERRSDMKGPLNILLVGVDPRKLTDAPLADSVMILHVSADLDRVLLSMPRPAGGDPAVPGPRTRRNRPAELGVSGSRVESGNPDGRGSCSR